MITKMSVLIGSTWLALLTALAVIGIRSVSDGITLLGLLTIGSLMWFVTVAILAWIVYDAS